MRRPSRKPFGEPPFDWTDTPAASGADLGRRGRANRGDEPIAEGKAYLRRRGARDLALSPLTLSYRDVEELLAERGLDISYETVRRWG